MVSSVSPPRCPRACNTKPEIRKPTNGGCPNCCASNPKKNATEMSKTSMMLPRKFGRWLAASVLFDQN